jgi:hypothetical protein
LVLIVALVLAVIGLAALVTAVVTSNELIAWVCIGASVIGVLLLIVDALRERSRGGEEDTADTDDTEDRDDETTVIPAVTDSEAAAEDYPEESAEADYPDEPAEAETSAVSVESNEDSSSDSKRD